MPHLAIIRPVTHIVTVSIPMNSTLLVGILVGATVGLIIGLAMTYLGDWLKARTTLEV